MSTGAISKDSYTCVSCRVAFKDAEIQRLHYKSDWHRYNLKRKVAELPAVTSEEFQRRVLNQRTADAQENASEDTYCKACKKTFASQNAFDNHLNSKKHKTNEKTFTEQESKPKVADVMEVEEGEEVEDVDSDEWAEDGENPIDNNDCLFCGFHSKSFLKNIDHMTLTHSFYIPDAEFCTDVEGLLRYLGEKIVNGFMCIWCNLKGKSFYSAEAARNHMMDAGHCRMLHEGEVLAEYTEFYDYSSSYPDAETTENIDEEVEVDELESNEFELTLPSGAKIGHRSLMRYFKQYINPNRPTALQVKSYKDNKKLTALLAHNKALGLPSTTQEVLKRARDIQYMKKMQSKLYMRLGVKNNKMQKHYREQVNF